MNDNIVADHGSFKGWKQERMCVGCQTTREPGEEDPGLETREEGDVKHKQHSLFLAKTRDKRHLIVERDRIFRCDSYSHF